MWLASGPASPGQAAAHELSPGQPKGQVCCPKRPPPHRATAWGTATDKAMASDAATHHARNGCTAARAQEMRLRGLPACSAPLTAGAGLRSPWNSHGTMYPGDGDRPVRCDPLKSFGTTFAQILCYSPVSLHAISSSPSRASPPTPISSLTPHCGEGLVLEICPNQLPFSDLFLQNACSLVTISPSCLGQMNTVCTAFAFGAGSL